MKKIMVLTACIMISAMSLGSQDAYARNTIELTAEEKELVKDNNDFAFNLFRQAREGESLVLSPLSITYALGMLNNGAVGQTQQEINTVLGFQTAGADAINSFCRKLLTEAPTLDKLTKVMIANNIYINSSRGYQIKEAFTEKAKQYYDATPESRDFRDGMTRDVINQWASDHTEGMIKEVLKEEEFRKDIVSYLLNALYFKSEWQNKFLSENTKEEPFDNGKATAKMMVQSESFRYFENELYKSIILPYGNGSFQMNVFLPQPGKSLDELIAKMDGHNWNADNYEWYNVLLKMPRFETDTDLKLNDIMMGLGMPSAFVWGEADFSEFCGDKGDIFIELMKQVAKIKVSEDGTEAAAVTVIAMYDEASPGTKYKEFIADRPFLYTISESSTGVILFMGQYMGESAANQRQDIGLTEEEQQWVNGNNGFAFDLMRQVRTANAYNNTVLSPISITYALGMLNNGAAGQTRQEILQVLGADNHTGMSDEEITDVLNKVCRKLATALPSLDQESKLTLCNNIYMNQPYQLLPGFMQKANDYYDATPETRDFHDGMTRNVINQWGSDHTEGMIEEVLKEDEFNEDAVSYLLNAIYFKGAWSYPFDAAKTVDEPFNGADMVHMMHRTSTENPTAEETFFYTDNDLYQAVCLPYGNGAFQMTVILPREGKSIGDVLDQTDGTIWKEQLMKKGDQYAVDLKLPRFESNTDIDLIPVMEALGMKQAFDGGRADFSGFCDNDVYIGLMKQVAKINVNEEGSEASAVTVIDMRKNMVANATFHATRPFLYIISEVSTNAILFIGQYTGTVTNGISELSTPQSGTAATPNATRDMHKTYTLDGRRVTDYHTPLQKGLYIVDGKKMTVK